MAPPGVTAWPYTHRTRALPIGTDESAHIPESLKGLTTDLTLLGRIVVVYCRLLQDDQDWQDELLHDFFRSLAADLEQLQSLRRTKIPHSEDEKPK